MKFLELVFLAFLKLSFHFLSATSIVGSKYNINKKQDFPEKQSISTNEESLEKIKKINNMKLKNEDEVVFSGDISGMYQLNHAVAVQKLINVNNPTKLAILENNVIDKKAFNDLMSQDESVTNNNDGGLFTVLKNIFQRPCSKGYLCIELGAIFGDFNEVEPKKTIIKQEQKVHLIAKPIVLKNNTKKDKEDEKKKKHNKTKKENITIIDDEDCDDFNWDHYYEPPRFKESTSLRASAKSKEQIKEKVKGESTSLTTQKEKRFYRKVHANAKNMAEDIFKQGLNLIIIRRSEDYDKQYERTFRTFKSIKESEEMAEIIKNTPCSKIIVITGIGQWIELITPSLIEQIMLIGGPDLTSLVNNKKENQKTNHEVVIVGRKGLCAYNGIFRVKDWPLPRDRENDKYFEDVSAENKKNLANAEEKEFYHLISLRLIWDLNCDNRFAWNAPTVADVKPFRGTVLGGEEVKIGGFNFGLYNRDVKEIMLRNIPCINIRVLSSNLLQCITGSSKVLGPGIGTAIVKLTNGLSSPERVCNFFEYFEEKKEIIEEKKEKKKETPPCEDKPKPEKKKCLMKNGKPCCACLLNKLKPGVIYKPALIFPAGNFRKDEPVNTHEYNLNSSSQHLFDMTKLGLRKNRFKLETEEELSEENQKIYNHIIEIEKNKKKGLVVYNDFPSAR